MKLLGRLSLALCLFLPSAALAAAPECVHCGCHQHLRKICRAICETKQEKKPVFSCTSEDFCVPGPSHRVGEKCTCDGPCPGDRSCHTIWQPTCAHVHTRRKLIKKEVTKTVPSIKWVVEYVCDDCCHSRHADANDESTAAQVVAATETSVADEAVESTPQPPRRKSILESLFAAVK